MATQSRPFLEKRVMENAQKSFISSSCWTERLGYVAGLATVEEYQRKADKYLIKSEVFR